MADKKLTIREIRKMKTTSEKIVMLTAYDAPTGRFAERAGIDMILVGDSLGMSALGYSDTIPVTMEDMIHHCKCVRRGAPNTFVVGDMPFMSYHLSPEQALANAARFMQEAACDCVKLETDHTTIDTVRRLVESGIPVCAHIGLLPQSFRTSGVYLIQGRKSADAERLVADAIALQDAGAFCIVLECVPQELAKRITEELDIPTIGIGAGPHCNGQVQVISDIAGYDPNFLPKHAKRFTNVGETVPNAIGEYIAEVKNGTFPAEENSFN